MTECNVVVLATNMLGLAEGVKDNPLLLAKVQESSLLIKEVIESLQNQQEMGGR